jgi:LPS O-antigen subunit length determinant protein (WzzB/FepE family)
MTDQTAPDELSLRDVFEILRRNLAWLLIVPAIIAGLTLIASLVLPKTFSSDSSLSVTYRLTPLGVGGAAESDFSDLRAVPPVTALLQAFTQELRNFPMVRDDKPGTYTAKFNDKNGLWQLTAKGDTAEQAVQHATVLMKSAIDYVTKRITEIVRGNIQAGLSQATLDSAASMDAIKKIDARLNSERTTKTANAGTAAALESQGVSPLSARANDPGYATLQLRKADLEARLVTSQGKMASAQNFLDDPARLTQYSKQMLQVQVLSDPALPEEADSPKPLLYTVLAAVLGLLIAIVGVFVAEAIRSPNEPAAAPQKAALPGSDAPRTIAR